jgi:hypothetical protein
VKETQLFANGNSTHFLTISIPAADARRIGTLAKLKAETWLTETHWEGIGKPAGKMVTENKPRKDGDFMGVMG